MSESEQDIPTGVCRCGCGEATDISTVTDKRRGVVKGEYRPYLPHHGLRGPKGEKHHLWKGGRVFATNGYVMRYARGHPDADSKGYVREHRWVMEQTLGRPLRPDEFVHHKNEDKTDNRPENLELMTKGEHNALHAPLRKYNSETMRAAGKKGAAARWGKK